MREKSQSRLDKKKSKGKTPKIMGKKMSKGKRRSMGKKMSKGKRRSMGKKRSMGKRRSMGKKRSMGKRRSMGKKSSKGKRRSMKRTASGLPKIDKGPDKRPNSCQTYVPFCESEKLLNEENMDRPCNEFFFIDDDVYRPCRHGRTGNKSQCRNKGDLTKIQCSNQEYAQEVAKRQQSADEDEREQRRQERLARERARQELASIAEYRADERYLRSQPSTRIRTKKTSVSKPSSIPSSSYSSKTYDDDTTDYNTTNPNMRTGWASDY